MKNVAFIGMAKTSPDPLIVKQKGEVAIPLCLLNAPQAVLTPDDYVGLRFTYGVVIIKYEITKKETPDAENI